MTRRRVTLAATIAICAGAALGYTVMAVAWHTAPQPAVTPITAAPAVPRSVPG